MKTDMQLKKDVSAELEWDRSINATRAGVAVKDGVVVLTGHLGTFAEKHAIERAVGSVHAVKAIAVEVDVKLESGHQRSDSEIAAAAELALQWHSLVPEGRMRVKVEKGWVTLSGDVGWDYQRQTAERVVRPLTGVVGVRLLFVASGLADRLRAVNGRRSGGAPNRHMQDTTSQWIRMLPVALLALAVLAGVATAQDRQDNQKRDAVQQRAPEQRPRPPEAGPRPPEVRPHAPPASPPVRPPELRARPAEASPNTRPPEARTRPPEAHARLPEPRPRPPDLRLDQRYHHDHYYPPRGQVVPVLPVGSIGTSFGQGNYFFHGGVWFRPWTGRFVVVVPPLGIVVPVLPPAYATLWIGGVPYYYANGVYYAATPGQGYVVVAPSPGAEAIQTVPQVVALPAPPEPVIYPRNGQSAAQTEADRQECNRWATTQASATPDATVYQRAFAACMDARGFTVR